ncbi:MAG: hypothetical protein PGN09_13510 [Sphingomonas fennica]
MTTGEEGRAGHRFARLVDKMESIYLAALRVLALGVATILLVYAAWLGASGLYKLSRDASSIKEQPAAVATAEITGIDMSKPREEASPQVDPLQRERAFYKQFVDRYFGLYRARFERFAQPDDAKVNRSQFEQRFVQIDTRLQSIESGDIRFDADRADLESLLAGMSAAAETDVTKARLQSYQAARKTKVTRTIRDTRTEQYCSYYGYYTGSCLSWDTRQVPVSRQVSELRLPTGIIAPIDLFAAYQKKYIETLATRREENAAKAADARAEIELANIVGAANLWTAVKIIGVFLVMMFLFLLIAIERHQRRRSRRVVATDA